MDLLPLTSCEDLVSLLPQLGSSTPDLADEASPGGCLVQVLLSDHGQQIRQGTGEIQLGLLRTILALGLGNPLSQETCSNPSPHPGPCPEIGQGKAPVLDLSGQGLVHRQETHPVGGQASGKVRTKACSRDGPALGERNRIVAIGTAEWYRTRAIKALDLASAAREKEEPEEQGDYALGMPKAELLHTLYARDHLDDESRSLVCLSASLTRYDLEGFAALTREALQRGLPESALRECCLQGVPYAGFPRALAALFAIADQLQAAPKESDLFDRDDTHADAITYFRGVYAGHAESLLDKIRTLDPNFSDLVLGFAYGSVLSRKGLSPTKRELMGIGSLAVLGQQQQLFAHAAGALRYGATQEACLECIRSVELLYPDTHVVGADEELTAFLSKIQARGV